MAEILSIAQAAEETPWGESTLYRIAPDPSSPFRKQAGRWVTTRTALVRWVEEGEKPAIRRAINDPMPKRTTGAASTVLAEVAEIERRAA